MANKKIDGFLDAVYSAAEAKSGKMIREIDRAGENALREYKAELRRSADAERRRETARAQKQSAQTEAHDEIVIRRELLAKRTAIADAVFAEVRTRIESYRATSEYKDALIKDSADVARVLGDVADAVILIGVADEAFAAEISAAAGIPVKVDSTIVLGGIKGVSAQMECDCTLDSRLIAARKDFERESGLSVD